MALANNGRAEAHPTHVSCDVLVIGAGPSGSAAAFWLAEAGHDVIVVEKKKHFPREKTCGDGLTPRAVRQLLDMDLSDELRDRQRFDGLRCIAFGKELVLDWPRHSDYPSYGLVIARSELDTFVAARAEKAGATLWQGAEAIAPLGENASAGGPAEGANVKHGDGHVTEVRASYVVVADGANSRFGRALGATRDKSVPLGLALRGYYISPRHAEPYIESHLDIRDRDGIVVPGYGWIFPMGDGRVNVGVGLLSTADRWKNVNTTKLMDAFVTTAPSSWCLSPETACGAPTGGKLPTGLSVGPRVGPDYVMTGDAAGSINPFNGEGIAYGYETGRMAAAAISDAIKNTNDDALASYGQTLQDTYGLYYKIASAFMRLMGRPEAMRRVVGTGMYSRAIMACTMRIMTNMMRDDETGPAELAYRAVAAAARRA